MKPFAATIPSFDIGSVPSSIGGTPDIFTIEAELAELPHLAGDERHETNDIDRDYRLALQVRDARDAIQRLPGPQQAIHLAISGKFALFDVIPATLDLAGGATIASVHIATLGFSKSNVSRMTELFDAGKLLKITLLCSHYFSGTSPEIHAFAAEEIGKRNQSFLSIRSHAKLLMMRLSDGRTITVESSANLRSCKNIEQMTLCGDPGLYAFHTKWIDSLKAPK